MDKPQNNNEEISLGELASTIRTWINYLVSRWLFITIFVVIGGITGFLYALLTKPVYTANTTFVLEESSSPGGGLGQYANIASMIGIDLGGASNGMFTSENIVEIYKSRRMLQTVLLSSFNFAGKNQLLIDRYLEFNRFRKKWENEPGLKDLSFSSEGQPTQLQDSILGEVIKEINKRYLTVEKLDKKSSIIKVSVKSKDQLFAKALTEKVVSTVNEFYIRTKTKKSLDNLAVLQQQTDSVRAVMNGAIISGASTIDATPNLNPTRQILRASVQRSQFNAEANKAMLAELLKNLELSKITLRKETPLIQIIDQPVLPLDEEKAGKLSSTIIASVLFGLLSAIYLIIRK